MGRNQKRLNYTVTCTTLGNDPRIEIIQLIHRKEVEMYTNLTAAAICRLINSKKEKVHENRVYKIERIIYE